MYHIKGQPIANIKVVTQASWMVQKILTIEGPSPQIYLQQLGSLAKVEWKAIMFRNLARPKAVFSMWLIIQERMLTADRLSKWSMNVDTACVFCKCHSENHPHLFYECTVIKELWNDIFRWMQIQVQTRTWSQLVCWFVEKAKKKYVEGHLLRMILAETLYSIWVEGNHRIFEKTHRDRQSIVREIIYICNIRAVGILKDVLQHKFI
ncbi:uncharacterized protein [Nicotiana sylvestris]|uniref:Uncharacterized protein LOC104235592 n=1 Tax=Nicotiana sylvestris TaxID=4096 RepID=A0A1U7XMH6_NICSY|nr:PREDICTED: uncharacterized protein LOC104235592 [Nicotiana sylvestris]